MTAHAKVPSRHSYVQTLRSTALIGGSTVINIGFGIIRNKVIAVLLGPAGIGLMGLYTTVADLAQTVAGLGVQSSGVRQIAEAAGSQDPSRIGITATILRRTSFVLGLLGAALVAGFAAPIAKMTFGSSEQTLGVALLAIAVFFRLVSAGQAALIQGMRRISDLARMSIIAGASSTVIGIPLIYFFGENGIVPTLIAMAAMSILPSWWYARKIDIASQSVTLAQTWPETAMLLKLGFAFLASGILTLGSAYAIRIIVLHDAGVEAAGLFQSAWALGGLYTGIILQAMGADFYPRLAGVAKDNDECNRLVNEQAHVCMLLAGPGVLASLTLAPVVMTVFYSSEFQAAVTLLRWICLGMMLRIVAWPMGFIVVAKGAQTVFFWTEVAAAVVQVGLTFVFMRYFGLDGTGMAFVALYVWHTLLIYVVVRKMSGFRWSAANLKLGLTFLPITAAVFSCLQLLPFAAGVGIGLAATLGVGLYALRALLGFCSPEILPAALRPYIPHTPH